MQAELPEGVEIIGINEVGEESGNDLVDSDLPWLQDTVEEDAWGLWDVQWRDVVLLDADGEFVGRVNLTETNLADPGNYEALKLELEALAPE